MITYPIIKQTYLRQVNGEWEQSYSLHVSESGLREYMDKHIPDGSPLDPTRYLPVAREIVDVTEEEFKQLTPKQ